jgi:hypothetical protein
MDAVETEAVWIPALAVAVFRGAGMPLVVNGGYVPVGPAGGRAARVERNRRTGDRSCEVHSSRVHAEKKVRSLKENSRLAEGKQTSKVKVHRQSSQIPGPRHMIGDPFPDSNDEVSQA